MKKESAELHVMWHVNCLLHAFPITIVTTIDEQGRINAAPYSLVIPFCSSAQNPQMLLVCNKSWHTAKNIVATNEFVLNYPRADQIKDITKTSYFYPEGTNELAFTNYTTMAANTVAPPRIVECYQHVECRVHEIIRPSNKQINIVADVLDISADAGLYALPRLEQVRVANAPIYYGMDEEQQHIYGNVYELVREEVSEDADTKQDMIIDSISSNKVCNYKETFY
jgi:flavin reductase (DIM6/NTAB) family NADH-FMN oxidoreductase RutF